MQTLLTKVDDARTEYLERVARAREVDLSRHDRFAAEVFLALPGDNVLLGNCCRLDGAGLTDTSVSIKEVSSKGEPLKFSGKSTNGTDVRCKSIDWGETRFLLSGGLLGTTDVPLPLDRLKDWFDKWIGARPAADILPGSIRDLHTWVNKGWGNDQKTGEPPDRLGVIHAASIKGDSQLSVDFGTAPLAAFEELLDVLVDSGAKKISIDAPSYPQRLLFNTILEILQDQHEKDVEQRASRDLIQEFLVWFAENASSLAARVTERDPDDPDRVAAHEEINEVLHVIDNRLDCAFRPGQQKAQQLVISARGSGDLAETVRRLVSRAPELPDWEFTAFQQPRQPDYSSFPTYDRLGNDLEIALDQIRAQVTPGVCQVAVTLYFDDYALAHTESLTLSARLLIAEVLGEYAEMGLLTYSAEPTPDDLEGTVPLAELKQRYDQETQALEVRLQSLGTVAARFDYCLSVLDSDITEFLATREMIARIEPAFFYEDLGAPGVVEPAITLWIPSEDLRDLITDALEEFQFSVGTYPTLAGEGEIITASGAADSPPSEGFRDWLRERLLPVVEAGGLLVGVESVLGSDTVYPADEKAKELKQEGRIDEAIALLKPVTDSVGYLEHGLLHARLGNYFRDLGMTAQAARYNGQALDLIPDEDGALKGETFTNFAVALQTMDRVPEAIPYYQAALSFDPENALRLYNLAQAYAIVGDQENAMAQLNKVAEADADYLRRQLDDSDLDSIRDSAAFQSLVQQLTSS